VLAEGVSACERASSQSSYPKPDFSPLVKFTIHFISAPPNANLNYLQRNPQIEPGPKLEWQNHFGCKTKLSYDRQYCIMAIFVNDIDKFQRSNKVS